jgi:hypothetical protein
MQTRRELLLTLSSMPAAAAFLPRPSVCLPAVTGIFQEAHCLSEESARGYRKLLDELGRDPGPAIILPANRELSYKTAGTLLERVRGGGLVILESGGAYSSAEEIRRQARILAGVFGIHVEEPVEVNAHEASYITYKCPQRILVRTFGAMTPVRCAPEERIAEFAGTAVAMRRSVGKGTIVYLGSILGVGLLAQEREARQVGHALLRA